MEAGPLRSAPLSLPSPADLEPIAHRAAEAAGLAVEAVHLLAHRIPLTVQVMVRCSDGSDVSLDACAALSAPLGEAIEASGLLEGAYVLEVSSPGIGEELTSDRDFVSFRGFPVAVDRRAADGRSSTSEGSLLGRDETAVRLNQRGRTVTVPRQEVERVRLVSPRDGP